MFRSYPTTYTNHPQLQRDVWQYLTCNFLSVDLLRTFSLVCHDALFLSEEAMRFHCNSLHPTALRSTRWMTLYHELIQLGRYESHSHSVVTLYDNRKRILKHPTGWDSNNVFVEKRIKEGEAFVEFKIHHTYDEMAVGVTAVPTKVRGINAWANIGCPDELVYNARNTHYGMIGLGKKKVPGNNVFQSGDIVAIYLNVPLRQVNWYKNGRYVGTNLPTLPLPDTREGYGIWTMVDYSGDEVEIVRFGYTKPYTDDPEDVAAFEKCLANLTIIGYNNW